MRGDDSKKQSQVERDKVKVPNTYSPLQAGQNYLLAELQSL